MKYLYSAWMICALLITAALTPTSTLAAESSTMDELKANYLTSIYEDSRIFIEGIELFINRDYPKFWDDIETGKKISKEMIQRYTRELKYFEGQLDALYEEFISYADTSANRANRSKAKVKKLEAKIYQILAYAYMRTGDFAMSYALMDNKSLVSQEFTIPLMDIQGKQSEFPLTRQLKRLNQIISANLNVVEIRMKYFFPTDLGGINAYLKVDAYNRLNPFNLTFLSYYDKSFLEMGRDRSDIIHFTEIIHFFNRIKYNNAFSQGMSDITGRERIYRLPIIKAEYGMDLKDRSMLGAVSSDNSVLALERLCHYKGFTRTDFRTLKVEEKQNMKKSSLADKNLHLKRMDAPLDKGSDGVTMQYYGNVPEDGKLQVGMPLRYGQYSLFEGEEFVGMIELVPCYKGQPCTKRSTNKAVTEVKVYNHELTFYQDTLDFIRMNTRMYGKTGHVSLSGSGEVHIGRGCSAKKPR
ncbi:MAG: hypothetical protein MI742_07725 [Desulfobacterales bacterium]|nr:hypothetical protein [Desulfobacterales bacterium]